MAREIRLIGQAKLFFASSTSKDKQTILVHTQSIVQNPTVGDYRIILYRSDPELGNLYNYLQGDYMMTFHFAKPDLMSGITASISVIAIMKLA